MNSKSNNIEMFVTFENEATIREDGWAHVAPFGDFPGLAVVKNADGSFREFPAIQRLDRRAVETMTRRFHSLWGSVKRYVAGCWIFNGHPDMANAGDRYPDKEPKGIVSDVQVREDGLYCKPVFTNEGLELLKRRRLCFSGRWSSQLLGEENGTQIFRPDELKSVALTDRPNLPVHFVNERSRLCGNPPLPGPLLPRMEEREMARREGLTQLEVRTRNRPAPSLGPPVGNSKDQTSNTKERNQNKGKMKTEIIVPILALHGVTFANAAEPTDEEIAEGLRRVSERAQAADGLIQEKAELVNEKAALNSQLTAARAEFENERNTRITDELGRALKDGRITAAERLQWQTRLENTAQFANELTALNALSPRWKTQPVTITRGDRRVEIANETERRGLVQELIAELANEKHLDPVKDYAALYNEAQRRHPALFEAMKQPQLHMRR